MTSPTALSRRPLGQARACLSLLAATAMIPSWLLKPGSSPAARAQARRFHRLLVKGFGLHIVVHGTPAPPAGTLFIANHISWIDIPLLGSLLDSAFVAKAEVSHWPGLGTLASRAGTLFVERGQRHASNGQSQAMRTHLGQGKGLILFPEGTTSGGRDVLPFRTSLFVAADSAAHVQPVAIVYKNRHGQRLSATDQRAIAWLDDDALLPHAMQLARLKGITAHVYFEPVCETADFADRKLLAQTCRAQILNRITG